MTRFAYGALVYAPRSTSVTLHKGGKGPLTNVGARDIITVKVAFLMPCGVPLVGPILCERGSDLALAHILPLHASERARETMKQLQNVANPIQRDLGLALGGSYSLLTAEATLPNQGAKYHKD